MNLLPGTMLLTGPPAACMGARPVGFLRARRPLRDRTPEGTARLDNPVAASAVLAGQTHQGHNGIVLDLASIGAAVAEVARSNGARMALVFGSFARGTATAHSDVDVMVVEETDLPFLARLDRYLPPLTARLRRGVEVFVYTPDEFKRMSALPFVRQARRDGVVVYES